MNPKDLDFKLIGITEEELYEKLLTNDDDYQHIPSDLESFTDNDITDDKDITSDNESIILSDTDSESNIPLSHLQQMLKQSLTTQKTFWDKNNKVTENILHFTAPCGIPRFIQDIEEPTPYTLFQLLLSENFIEYIVFQTNLYAEQSGKSYKPTNIIEIKTFIGMNFLMGIKPLPSFRDYWSTSKLLRDNYISSLMPVRRFSWLLSNLHLNDNSEQPKRNDHDFDKLYKVRPLLINLQAMFAKCFLPSENLAIDESMIKFKGRSSLKQYMPKKPIKRGYKVWVLADQSGYCLKFDIYTGKTENKVEKSLGSRVVKNLMQGLENKGHNLYIDNYFTSVALLEDLQDKKINTCGTVNISRKNLPTFTIDKTMKRGDFEYSVSNSGLLAVKWRDKRNVHLLSNYHSPKDVGSVKRKNKDGTSEEVPCPKLLIDYNKHMNFVDKFDQNKGTYEVNRKSKKWWHRIFFYILDACVVNAFIIYKMLNLPPITMKTFRLQLLDKLITESSRKRSSSAIPVLIKKQTLCSKSNKNRKCRSSAYTWK